MTHTTRGRALILATLAAGTWAGISVSRSDTAATLPCTTTAGEPVPAATPRADAGERRTPEARTRARGWYAASAGTRLTFAVKTRSGAVLHRPAESQQEDAGTVVMQGPMQVTVLDRRGDELVAAVALPGVQLTTATGSQAAGARLADLGSALARPALVRMDATGRALGYRFAPEHDFFARTHLRTLLVNLRFIVPEDAGATWTAQDADPTGTFEAAYGKRALADDGVEVTRERRRYVALHGAAGNRCGTRIESRATARLARDTGWLVAAQVRECLVLVPQQLAVEVHNEFTATVALEHTGPVDLRDLPAAGWRDAWAPVAGDAAEAIEVADADEASRWRKTLADMPLSGLVEWFTGLAASGAQVDDTWRQAWDHLAWKCRLDPEAIDALCGSIRDGRYDEKTASLLLNLIGDAGTPEAQAALAGLHADARVPAQLRAAATASLLQAERPTTATVQRLLATATGPGRTEDLGKLSLLVLGTLAGRHTATIEGRSALAALIDLEPRARADGILDAWLLALGNTRDPQVGAHVSRHLGSEDAAVRQAAVIALRGIKTPVACDLLAARAAGDKDTMVRLRAVESLGQHGTQRAKAALRTLLAGEARAEVREAVLVGLAQSPAPADLALLRRAARDDPSDAVRKLAKSLLGSA